MKHFITFLLLIASVPVYGQLTVTGDQFSQAFLNGQLSGGDTYSDNTNFGLQPLVDLSGANQQWDFSSLSFVKDAATATPTVVAYPGGAANASDFIGATHVQITKTGLTTDYSFYKIDQTGMYFMGTSQDYLGSKITNSVYTPPFQNLKFPITYQTSWSASSTVNSNGTIAHQQGDFLVDGWGSFTLPGNKSAQCLRLMIKSTDTTFGIPSTTFLFEWINLSKTSATIGTNASKKATNASYTVPAANSVLNSQSTDLFQVSIGSNPVNETTNVSFTMSTDAAVLVSLTDALGRQSQVLMNGVAHSGINTLPLDPLKLVNGTYMLRVTSSGNSSTQKLIIAH